MNIAFRIDVSGRIGMGHYIRMSALADAFKEMYCCCTFYTGEDEPINYTSFDIVIIDTYQVDDSYIANIRNPKRLLVCYDDNALYTYCCDVLLNANLHADQLDFMFHGKPPKLLLGAQYALLRREFWEEESILINDVANNVFICFGGSDVRNFTPFAVKALQQLPNINLTVVLGDYTECDDAVIALESANVNVLKTPSSIADVMKSCDIAVVSAGSMVYELAALGIPSIIITQADNQYKIAHFLESASLMKWLGDWDAISPESLHVEVENLRNNFVRRKDESDRLSNAVNRKGALNTARAILEVANEAIR